MKTFLKSPQRDVDKIPHDLAVDVVDYVTDSMSFSVLDVVEIKWVVIIVVVVGAQIRGTE